MTTATKQADAASRQSHTIIDMQARIAELEAALRDMFALYDGKRYTMLEHPRIADRARAALAKVST